MASFQDLLGMWAFFMSRLKRAAMWGAMTLTFSDPLPWRLGTLFVGAFDESGSDRPGEEVISMFEMCSLGQVQQFVICGHVERRWTIPQVVDCCCVCDPRKWGVLYQKLCQSIFSYVQQSSVYALPNLALCLHCHQRMGYQSSSWMYKLMCWVLYFKWRWFDLTTAVRTTGDKSAFCCCALSGH